MDAQKIIQTLQASLQPEHREEAEKLLAEMHKMIGFAPTLLQIVLEPLVDLSIRQAGGVFLKNMILRSWKYKLNYEEADSTSFAIHNTDKDNIRNVIVAAIVNSEIPIQSILKVALEKILKVDYPSRFPVFIEQLGGSINSSEFREFHGALVCLHDLIKACEHKTYEKDSVVQIMSNLLPILHHRMGVLIPDTSDNSFILQKLILKIFYSFTFSYLQPTVLEADWIAQWHMLLCSLLENFNSVNNDSQSLYWKRQKWVSRIFRLWFNTYGSPGYVASKYGAFADWYLKSFVPQVLTSFLKICDAYRQQTFISSEVMSTAFHYFNMSMLHAFSWKILRMHFDSLLQDVIVPLLSFNNELAELWENDPLEYIRSSTDYESDETPAESAAIFVKQICTSRKGVLDKCMQYCIHVLTSDFKPEIKDGAFHLIGTVCHNLLKNQAYKEQLENFMTTHVLALFEAPEGYRRARACWLVGRLSRAEFSNVEILRQTAMMCRHLMCSDCDLPVRVDAAKSIFALINDQEAVKDAMRPHFPDLVMQLLKLLRETEFDDLNGVFRSLLKHKEIIPISVQILQHLSGTFLRLVGVQENGVGIVSSGDGGDAVENSYDDTKEYQCVVATGVMENIESIITVMEENAELVAASEGTIAQLVHIILKNEIDDFYDEAFSLVCSLTCQSISPIMWSVFDWLYEAYNKDACDYFSSMAPALHNYIEIDPKAFIESPERVKMFISLCVRELQKEDNDDDIEAGAVHAAKLLEVLIINFHGQLDGYISELIETAINRVRKTNTTDLRIRCLLIIIASIITSTSLVLPIFCSHVWPETQTPIIEEVLKNWLENVAKFHGVHDQRMCVLGLCTLLSLSADQRPPAVDVVAPQYLPSLLHVLNALKESYATKKELEKDSEEDDSDDESGDGDAVDSDTDVVDEESTKYLDLLEAVEADLHEENDDGVVDDEDDEDSGDYDDYDTDSLIEAYTSELDKDENEMDEYVTFYHLMTQLETSDTAWYQRLISSLTDAQKSEFKEIAQTAVNCMAQKESKRIEKAGGYNFQQTDVPTSFNFSGDPPPQA